MSGKYKYKTKRSVAMYLYSLHGYGYNEVLTHTKEFTQEEFKCMCDEVPKIEICKNHFYYDDTKLSEYLIKKHKFKKVEYQAGLFLD